MLVSMGPGATQFKKTFSGVTSRLRTFVNAMTPALAAEQTAKPRRPSLPAREPSLTIRPDRWRSMMGRSACGNCMSMRWSEPMSASASDALRIGEIDDRRAQAHSPHRLQIPAHDGGAVPNQELGDRLSDALDGAGHDRELPLEVAGLAHRHTCADSGEVVIVPPDE